MKGAGDVHAFSSDFGNGDLPGGGGNADATDGVGAVRRWQRSRPSNCLGLGGEGAFRASDRHIVKVGAGLRECGSGLDSDPGKTRSGRDAVEAFWGELDAVPDDVRRHGRQCPREGLLPNKRQRQDRRGRGHPGYIPRRRDGDVAGWWRRGLHLSRRAPLGGTTVTIGSPQFGTWQRRHGIDVATVDPGVCRLSQWPLSSHAAGTLLLVRGCGCRLHPCRITRAGRCGSRGG